MPVTLKLPPSAYRGYLVNVQYSLNEFGIKESDYTWERDIEDFIRIQRYKQSAIDDMLKELGLNPETFWEEKKDILINICKELSVIATGGLRRIIGRRAYVSELTHVSEDSATSGQVTFDRRENYWSPNDCQPTGQFMDAWSVVVSFHSSGTLHFDLEYDYNSMNSEEPPSDWGYPMHASFWGQDYRAAMADILNFPTTFKSNGQVVHRIGRWHGLFDKKCREEYYPMFIQMCKDAGLLKK